MAETTTHTAEDFAGTIDPGKSRVIHFPGFVAVFGGALSGADDSPASKREAFLRHVVEHRPDLSPSVLVPESYPNWDDYGNAYQDLLEFEEDLAYLTSAVVVFPEGPGSFAELGAFAKIDSLAKCLVVVIEQTHFRASSFIRRGPIESLRRRFGVNSVCVIPDGSPADLRSDAAVILEAVDAKRTAGPATQQLLPTSQQHQILLVLDLVHLHTVLIFSEIEALLENIRVPIDTRRLRKILFLLAKLKLISTRDYGDQVFYLAPQPRSAFLNYATKSGGRPFDRDRFSARRLKVALAERNRRRVCELEYGEGVGTWT